MTSAQTAEPTLQKPLRLWPGVVAAGLIALGMFVLPVVAPDAALYGFLGAVVGGLIIALWWTFFSRAPWLERLGTLALIVVALFVTSRVVHESIRGGMMGMMLGVYSVPLMGLALVAGAVAGRRLAAGSRRRVMVAIILLACAAWTLIRTDGITGDGVAQLAWRWTETHEQRLAAKLADGPAVAAPPVAAATPEKAAPAEALPASPTVTKTAEDRPAAKPAAEPSALPPIAAAAKPVVAWAGFRGSERDGIIHGVRLETDWSKSPPVELWRRPIGPAWSSFAVRGDLLYTQEQRGEDEIVACYKATTGEPVWIHRDPARFWESNAGAGPRATPTLSDGRVYTLGATGIVNALDAGNGVVVWSRNAASDIGGTVPFWGFSSSPLVVGDVVIVYAGGLAAYDRATGKPRWTGKVSGDSYSSPHLVTIDGVAQVIQLTTAGATSIAPADGTVLWEHAWPGDTIVQPARIADRDILIPNGRNGGLGVRRIAVAHGADGWKVEERWTSAGMKPYFNDFVVHKGHLFGFDGRILACVDLNDGARRWKGGRYGSGQLVLLPDQDLLLVLSEEGELVLVGATPDKFTELARFPAIEGKTWNHPVLVGNTLLVRNGEEMAAFRLSLASR
jgi:outer membrane protein assembly factor BamB